MKKEFTEEPVKEFSKLSDVELIELMVKGTYSDARVNAIKGILDYRLKKVLNDLKEATKKSSKVTERHDRVLIGLTIVIATSTIVLLFK